MHEIRWLSRFNAVNTIYKCYQLLLSYFENAAVLDVTADGLVKQIKGYQFFVIIGFLLDILTTLCKVNKTFQIPGYHPYSVIKKIDEVCNVLTSRYLCVEVQWGPFAAKNLKQIENSEINVTYGLPLRGSSDVKKDTEKNVVAFVRAVVDNLHSRFSNMELFQASKIFDPTNLPSSLEEFHTYGDKELELLTMTYSELIDYSKCVLEWDMFKETMRANYKECKFHKLIIILVTDESLYMQYPALSTLAEMVLVYPASTSEVEQGFSFQNAIKTKF